MTINRKGIEQKEIYLEIKTNRGNYWQHAKIYGCAVLILMHGDSMITASISVNVSTSILPLTHARKSVLESIN